MNSICGKVQALYTEWNVKIGIFIQQCLLEDKPKPVPEQLIKRVLDEEVLNDFCSFIFDGNVDAVIFKTWFSFQSESYFLSVVKLNVLIQQCILEDRPKPVPVQLIEQVLDGEAQNDLCSFIFDSRLVAVIFIPIDLGTIVHPI